MSTGAKSLSSLTVALVLFGLAGSAVMVAVPGLLAGPVRPEFTVFLVAGVAAIVLTAGFFGYIYRLDMGFGRTVLVLAAGYNATDFDALFSAAFAQTLAFGLLLVREATGEPVGPDAWQRIRRNIR